MRAAVTQREALLYESTSQKAALLSQIQYYDLAPGYKAQQQALIETISQPELAELARQWLAPKNMWILIVADANQVEAELKQINGWPLVRWQLH